MAPRRTLEYGRPAPRRPRFLPPWLDRAIGIALVILLLLLAAAFWLGSPEGDGGL